MDLTHRFKTLAQFPNLLLHFYQTWSQFSKKRPKILVPSATPNLVADILSTYSGGVKAGLNPNLPLPTLTNIPPNLVIIVP